MADVRGKFVWYDLRTTDAEAAARFYERVLGVRVEDSGMPGQAYLLVKAGDVAVAGMMAMPEGAREKGWRPGWVGHIAVDDVDAYAEKVKAAGGTVEHGPSDIPGVGRFAAVADPHGARFVLFKGNGEAPADAAPGTPGHLGWHELQAGDVEEAWAFYSGLFGWTQTSEMDMGTDGVYRMFTTRGVAESMPVGGMMKKNQSIPAPFWQYYFNVGSVVEAMEKVKGSGGRVWMGPQEVPGGQWIAVCSDPQEAPFAVVGAR